MIIECIDADKLDAMRVDLVFQKRFSGFVMIFSYKE